MPSSPDWITDIMLKFARPNFKDSGQNADNHFCRYSDKMTTKMKRFFSLSLAAGFLLTAVFPPNTAEAFSAASGILSITAPSALLIDAQTQRVIYAKSPHSRRAPASTTKVMTALVILEKISLDRVIKIPSWVRSVEPSKIYLKSGEKYRVRDLLHATLISSANDAAEVLGVTAAGSRTKFAQWMNAKARAIGCRDTHFTTASGLPLGHQYSTAYDLALIMKYARKNAFIVDSMERRYHAIYSTAGRKIYLKNHNRLLWKTEENSVIGKTGWTRKGKACFVGRIQWHGREVFVSLLGSHRLWHDLGILLNYQFGAGLFKIQKNKKRWSNSQTRKIQFALTQAGFSPGSIDGKFGPRTVKAVQRFQKHQGIRSDGIVGTETCSKLSHYGLSKSLCR
jgi:D-alanyl-D-alanine carboxypeptidase (penicillin-binding protein 5/6)